jgi:hypothetical protein
MILLVVCTLYAATLSVVGAVDAAPLFASNAIVVDQTTPLTGRCVFAIDMDGDNDLDMLAAITGSDQINWYENDNQVFTERTISTSQDGPQVN